MESLEEAAHHSGGIYNYFEGATIHNLVINGNMNKSGTEHYEARTVEQKKDTTKGKRETVMDYVGQLMPVVTDSYKERYQTIWKEILEQEAVSSVVYDRGRQAGTTFNRNLVAQITHMMVGMVIDGRASDVKLAELLEPEKGKKHPVRNALATSPEDKQVKKAVNEVLTRYTVKDE